MTPDTFRFLRLHYGVRQKDMAREIGVTASALCQYERGRENAVAPERLAPKADEWADRFLRDCGYEVLAGVLA